MKNYVITGSIGHISKPIILGLIKAGNKVSVITSNESRAKEIESLGATPLVGNIQDSSFVKQAFKGTDVVYTMIPPIWQTTDWRASQRVVATNYTDAIKANAITYVVNLSSVGAHAPSGVGPVTGLYDFEQQLNQVAGLNVVHLRPSFFYYNFLAQIGMIKQAGIMGANYGKDQKISLVHTRDIAAAALEELLKLDKQGATVRYIIGDERTGQEVATVLGQAIGKALHWVEFTDEQQKQGLLSAGLPETIANGYTEMGHAMRTGIMQKHVQENKPVLSAIKLEDFAPEFAAAFNA